MMERSQRNAPLKRHEGRFREKEMKLIQVPRRAPFDGRACFEVELKV